jgi:hypothetical protein
VRVQNNKTNYVFPTVLFELIDLARYNIRSTKLRALKWVGHTARIKKIKISYKIFVGIPEEQNYL